MNVCIFISNWEITVSQIVSFMLLNVFEHMYVKTFLVTYVVYRLLLQLESVDNGPDTNTAN